MIMELEAIYDSKKKGDVLNEKNKLFINGNRVRGNCNNQLRIRYSKKDRKRQQ